MFDSVDPRLLDLLIIVLIVCLAAFTWFGIKLLAKATEAIDEYKKTNIRVNKMMDRIEEDYDYVSQTVQGLTITLDKINAEVIEPIRTIGSVFKIIQGVVNGIVSRGDVNTSTQDYLPEPEYD